MILIIAVIFIGLYFLLEQLFKSAWGTKWMTINAAYEQANNIKGE